ncbi:MAG: hypothetical protein NTV44_04075, partial [Firmicutes bacterium]|nr:hypothetical protein [Bacillota bacterium]
LVSLELGLVSLELELVSLELELVSPGLELELLSLLLVSFCRPPFQHYSTYILDNTTRMR